jgi:pyridoxine 4-dehydrogenase
VCKIAVIEIEVSLWSWEQEIRDVVAWSRETETPVFCYSPLGRGFITRTYQSPEDIPEGDFKKSSPRFQGEAFYENLKLVDQLDELAKQKGVSTPQLALAWIVALSPFVSGLQRGKGEMADGAEYPDSGLVQYGAGQAEHRGRVDQVVGR